MAQLLKGKPVADAIIAETRLRAEALRDQGIAPTLAIVRAGADPEDLSYERTLARRAEQAGVSIRYFEFDADASQKEVEGAVLAANADASIHGCLVLRPLPGHLDEVAVCKLMDPAKDVDCISKDSLARIFTGWGKGFAPSTAEACVRLLDHYGIELQGAHAVVVGRSLVVGKPLSQLLLSRNATVTVCHSRTRGLAEVCRSADIVVVAVGHARALGAECFREGQIVIDVGIDVDETGAPCGDVDFEAAEPIVSAITPVPAGVGPVTSAVTIEHVLRAAELLTR